MTLARSRLTLSILLIVTAALLVAACGGTDNSTASGLADGGSNSGSEEVAIEFVPDLDAVPGVDTSKASVPLEDVVFDTFDGNFVQLKLSTDDLRRSLRDAIRPIYNPLYGDADDLPWLNDTDLVLGYVGEEESFAYPIRLMNFRELVNDEIDGIPVLISYCPLCASGVVYDRRLDDGEALVFGNTSALFESDLVMFDDGTGSYWFQVGGQAIVGDLTGARLDALPSTVATWGDWLADHPDTRVLIGDGEERFAHRSPPSDLFGPYAEQLDRGIFPFPVNEDKLDARLRASEIVVVVEVGDAARAYPPGLIGDLAVNDQLAGRPIVVFSRQSGFASAYEAAVEGRSLTFRIIGQGIVDEETETRWDFSGQAVSGELEGAQLEPLPSRRGFWFSLAGASPGLEVYLPGGSVTADGG